MKLSTTLDQLLKLVVVSDEDAREDEGSPRAEPGSAPSRDPQPEPARPAPSASSEPEEPWRAQYTPREETSDDSAASTPWEARFTPEAPQAAPERTDAYEPEPQSAATADPPADAPAEDQPAPTPAEPALDEELVARARTVDLPSLEPAKPEEDMPETGLPDAPQQQSAPSPAASVDLPAPGREQDRPSPFKQLEAAVTVAESLNLGLHLGMAVTRIATASVEGSAGTDSLREAVWLIERYIALLERRPIGADIHRAGARLAETGGTVDSVRALADALDVASKDFGTSHAHAEAEDDAAGRIRRLSDTP